MRNKGTHTYDIFLEYLACPVCLHILESRSDYEYHLDHWIKTLLCTHCHSRFTVEKFFENGKEKRRYSR